MRRVLAGATVERDGHAIVALPRCEVPLSFAQQRLWLLDQLEPSAWTYNVSVVRRLYGDLRLDALQRALDEVVARHETLRTTFAAHDGPPVQVVSPPGPVELSVADLTDRPPAEAAMEARRLAGEEARRRFDLAAGPVFRGLLVRLAADDHVLALMMHHIVTDAWSEAVLLGEISVLYNAFARGEPSPLAPLPAQYADFAVWQRNRLSGDAFRAHLDYWAHRLDDMPQLLELPADRPRPAKRSGQGGAIDLAIAAPLTRELRRVTVEGRATLFMTLIAAFQLLLARYSGRDDIAIGTAIGNRARLEDEALIGFFANTLVLRTDLSGEPSFMELLARVRAVALGAYGHQDLPFEQLVKALRPERSLSHTSLFQHMFVFQNTPGRDLALDGICTAPFPIEHDTAMFDLTLTLSEADDGLVGTLEYTTDLYDRTTAERLVRHFRNLLDGIVADPHRPIGELDLLDDAEREQAVVGWNDTRTPFPGRCIHELFEDQVAAHPDAIALTADDVSLTFNELNERANCLASHLRSLGVGPEVRVGICLHRSGDAVIALLATLKAGGAYLPLDPEYPPARLAFMLEDATVDVVVTEAALLDRVDACRALTVCVDLDAKRIAAASTANPSRGARPNNLAYVVYTSGSTGTPKGVMVEHRAVVALLFGVDYIRFEQVGALLHMAPLAFDASTFEIWGALLHGRRCVVYTDRNFSLERFLAVMQSEKIDTLWLTAALFNVVIDEDWRHLEGVRQLIIGGEALSPPHVARALRLLPMLRLVNGYGPTEATTFAACYEIRALEPEAAGVPIGRPIANTELYILDADGRPVPIGVAGELYIGGAGLARGYLDRPELTAERFLGHPFSPDPQTRVYRTGDLARYRADGNIEFLGRIDDQVKIRGFRVEPGEVEAVLRQHPAVGDAAVVAPEDGSGQRRLVAYVVTAPTTPTSTGDLRDHLRARLPDYLVPSAFVTVDTLPLTSNGKVDRVTLASFEETPDAEVSYAAPATATERVLANLWAEVLGLERVGIDDNFFSSGGDSLLGAVLFAKTTRRTGKAIPLSLLFRGPTIREVASALDDGGAEEQTSVVPLRAGGSKPPLFLAHGVSGLLLRYMHLVRRLDPDQPVYGLQPTMQFVDSRRRLRIEDLAGRYVEDIVRLQPRGPYRLAGFCFGGIVVLEVAHQLERLGHTVATLALFDAEPPSSPRASRAKREAAQLASLVRRRESATVYVRRRLANARVKVRRWPWLADYWLHVRTGRPLPNRWDDVERVQSVQASPLWRSLSRALASYVAPTTKCTVTFFRAGEPTADKTEVRFLPGGDGVGESYVIDGPGLSHGTVMEEPHVGALATALTELLDRAGAAAPAHGWVESPTGV